MADLPDANVWLALAWSGHAGHPAARGWWDSASSVCFCRVTQMALLRLLTNAAILGEDVKSQSEAWMIQDALRRSPRVSFAEEPARFEMQWRKNSSRNVAASKKWTDDYLSAFAQSGGWRLVTFDQDFRACEGLSLLALSMANPTVPPPAS